MRTFYLIVFWIFSFLTSYSQSLEVKSYNLEKNIYAIEYGTEGMILSFEYFYTNNKTRLFPSLPSIRLYKNGMQIFVDSTKILLLKTDEWTKASVFIPYRAINLLNGQHENVQLNLSIKDLLNYQTTISFNQPTRYAVEINLKGGAVKKQLKQYDKSVNPEEWLPDVYYYFTTNDGTEPLYRSSVNQNSFELKEDIIKFHLLEGEQLYWAFYDRDGEKDQLLGVYDKITAKGDYKDEIYGQMFGSIKNLEFSYSQRTQAIQAISIYSDPTYLYKNKKGVAVTIEYDLAKAYIGKEANIRLNCYNKNGVKLDLPVFYAIENTPEVDALVSLKVKGKLKYFIPFYVWNNECQDLEFYFELDDNQQINASRHTLLYPIEFEGLVINSSFNVQENIVYQGAKGVRVYLEYELVELYENAPLEVTFTAIDGSILPFDIYNTLGEELAINIKDKHITKNPRIADRLSYFIPYLSLKEQAICVNINLIPDLAINILRDTTPILKKLGGWNDVAIELSSASGRFRADNYGQVLEIKILTPKFYLGKAKMNIRATKNGRNSEAYILDGMWDSTEEEFLLKKDSGRCYIVFPHRNITTGTKLTLKALVTSLDNLTMSDSIEWEWKAPTELFNRTIEVALSHCKFERQIIRDTTLDSDFPWEYVIEVGGSTLVQDQLVKRFRGKKIKEQFIHNILVNREDNIKVKVVHKHSNQKIVLWEGDLGKWSQNEFKAMVEDRFPYKLLKINTKLSKDQKGLDDEGVL